MNDSSQESLDRVEEALRRAARRGKNVAVIFGASWCPDSRALDAALLHPLVAPIIDRFFEVVAVDLGNRDRNLTLLERYGIRVEAGIPTIAFLDADGRLVKGLADGELRTARAMTPLEIAELFHRWQPREEPENSP